MFNIVWNAHEDEPAQRHALLLKLFDMLASLRDAGIAHLDLHPGNVMVSSDPLAPLRAIDCGQMSMAADPATSAAIHLGVFLHELNGKRLSPSPRLEEGARNLLYHLVGGDAGFSTAETLVSLLVRYSSKKPFARRRLVKGHYARLDTSVIETRLEALLHIRGRSVHASHGDRRHEQRLVSSIENALTLTR